MGQLDAIPIAQLSPDERVNAEVLRTVLENAISDARFRTWEMPFNSDSSFWTYLDSSQPFDDAAGYRRYIARMGDIPRFFDEEIANMRAGLARGFSVPRATLDGRDRSVAAFIVDDPEKSSFYKPFEQFPSNIPATEQQALRDEARAAIQQSVMPAYRKLLGFIRDEYLPRARTTISVEALPDGDAFYRAQVREYTTTDMTPEQIHQIGLKEVARIDAEMRRVMRESGFKGSLPRVPEVPENRSAILREDAGRVARRLGLCRQASRRRDRPAFRPAAARPLRDHSGARRDCAVLHVGPRRARELHDEHLRPAGSSALQHPGADTARMRAGPQLPGRARR